jgi:hypothetical protein
MCPFTCVFYSEKLVTVFPSNLHKPVFLMPYPEMGDVKKLSPGMFYGVFLPLHNTIWSQKNYLKNI